MTEVAEVPNVIGQELFQAILEGITDCVYFKDGDGIYRYINSTCRITGKTPSEIIGCDDNVLFPPEHAERIAKIDREIIRTGQPYTYTETVPTNNGKVLTYYTTKFPYRNAAGETLGIIGISRDITAQQNAENKLRETHELLNGVLKNAPLPIYTLTNEGQFELFNEQFAAFTGHEQANLTGKMLEDICDHGDSHLIREVNQKVIDSSEPLVQEEWLDTNEGRQYYKTYKFPIFDAKKNVKSVGSILFDLTDHKRAEERVRESEAELRALFSAMSDTILVLDDKGTYLKVPETAGVDLLCHSPEVLIGKNVYDFFDKEQADFFVSNINTALQKNKPHSVEYTIPINGREICFAATISPLSHRSVVWVSRDVTIFKQAEAKLRESESELRGLFAAMNDVILVIGEDCRFHSVAPTRPDLLFKPAEELVGKTGYDVFPTETAEFLHTQVKKALASETFVNVEYPLLFGEKKIWFAATVSKLSPSEVVWVARDITAIKRAEERFRAVVECTASAILMVDENGIIALVNSETERLFGYTRDELVGESIDMLVPDYLRPNHPALRQSYFKKPKAVKLGAARDLYCRRKDGTEIPMEIGLDYFTTEEGRYVLVSIIDISERKAAEKAVRDSEERLQLALQFTNAGSWDWDFNENRIHWSVGHFSIMGYEPNQTGIVDFKTWASRVHPEDLNYVNLAWQRTRDGKGAYEAEYRIFRADNNEMRWVRGAGRCLFDANGNAIRFVGVMSDITERKLAEQARLVSETSLLLAAEAAALGTWDYNYKTQRYVISEQLLDVFGVDADEEKTIERWQQTVYPEDLERVMKERRKYVEGKDVVNLEYRIVHQKTRQIRWITSTARTFFEESGQPIRTVGVSQDITERKKAEQALRESEERYRQLIEFAPTAILLLNSQGILVHVNPAACQMLGYEFNELIGMQCLSLTRSDNASRIADILSVTTAESEHQGEWELLTKSGAWIWVEANARLLPNGMWQAFVHDVTERKKIEQQLRQSQKMEAVGRLAGGVAHDFNNLLTVITGYSDLMLWKLRKEDPFYKHIYEIKRAAERASGLTGQLLAFSRQQPQQLKVLNLNDVIESLKKMLKRLLSEDIELVTSLDDELGHTKADQGQIEQILMNLVVNARDAVSETDGGRIFIETKNVSLSEDQAKQSYDAKAGLYVALIVSDTGCGMDAATQSKIFEPFFTTKEAGKGTGLGLSTVYGIVQQSGGFITVYSEVGYGTTLKIYLPRVDQPAVRVTGELPSLITVRGTETILLVEDDEMVRQLIKEVLLMNGYKVLEANNGATALLLTQQYKEPIDLLLTDIVMPEMSGRKLAERMSETHPQMQVIYMSGYTTDTVIHHGISSNVVNFIEKPFKFEELTTRIREVLDKKD
jgi:two-component system, cell cycle sensor histidine kinase and response regulator CckA